jgi:MFS transporter, DHA3 family, tetracycline resistance protein
MRPRRRLVSAYRLYLILEAGTSFLLGITYATITVYWVVSGRLNPLQLLLLGTGLELTYFVLQLPTGVLADMVSRRLCVLAGLFIVGLALVIEGLSPSFANLLAAQAVLGLGAALNNGAQEAWIADELAGELAGASEAESTAESEAVENGMTSVYLRATQLGLLGTVAGSLLSGVIALIGLNMPLLVGGGLVCMFAVAVAFVMPERNFRPAACEAGVGAAGVGAAGVGAAGVGAVARQSRIMLASQTRSTRRAIVAVPGLLLLFGMTLFVGLWSESFDRLWGAFLLRDIRLPRLGGLHPAMWFSLLACAVALVALGSTEVARRRTQRLGSDSVAAGLLVLVLAIGAGVVALATARSFVVAIGAYLAVSVLRPVLDPLVSGWMVTRIEPSVRATALSAKDMFDSGGQIVGGPVIGAVGTLASIRIALLAGAAALVPAIGCLAVASRRIRPRSARTVAEAEAEAEAATAAPA